MPIPLMVMAGLSGLSALSGLFGNKKSKQEQTQNTQQHQYGSETGVTEGGQDSFNLSQPVYDDDQWNMRQQLMQMFGAQANKQYQPIGNVAESIITPQIQSINRGFAGAQRGAASSLAARGLGHSPISALIDANLNNNRLSQITQAANQGPQIQLELQKMYDDMSRANRNDAGRFFSSLPVGQVGIGHNTNRTSMQGSYDRYGDTQSQGTQTTPGNMLGGLFGGAGSMLGYLAGQGAFNSAPKPNSGGGNAMNTYNPNRRY